MKFKVGDRVKLILRARRMYGYPPGFRSVIKRLYRDGTVRIAQVIRKDLFKGQLYHFPEDELRLIT